MATASDFIPKGIVELARKGELDRNDNFAVATGNRNNFKTYQASFGSVVDKISSTFQEGFSFSNLTVDNLKVNDTLCSDAICCNSLYAETVFGASVDIPTTVVDVDVISEYKELPDITSTVYCFAQISSEDGKLIGGIKQIVPDSRLDCKNLSSYIDSESERFKQLLEEYTNELNNKLKDLQISVNNLTTINDKSNMNLAIDTNNIIDITPIIPYIKNAGVTGEVSCSAFYEIPFGGTLAINYGHYFTIDTYDSNNPVTVEPYLFAKSGGTSYLTTQNARTNQEPTLFIKVKKGMSIATGNTQTTDYSSIKNCILLYPELDDDLFSSDKTIEVNNLLYDPYSGNNRNYNYYQYLSSYQYYKNEATDKQKYQIFYVDLQNISDKECSLTCSIFKCTDVSPTFNQHFLSGDNAPNKLTPNTVTKRYHSGYNLKTDTFKVPANSTVTRKYVINPEDVILIFDNQSSYTDTITSGIVTRKPNVNKIMGNKVIVLSKGYVDINENSNYSMIIDLNGTIQKETDLSNLKNIGTIENGPTVKVQYEDINGTLQSYDISNFVAYEKKDEIPADAQLSIIGSKECPIIKIGDDVFSDTECVKSVSIPYSVTSMGNRVFKNCLELTSTNIPFVTETLSSVFEGCGKLQYIKTGGTLQNIGDRFYKNCEVLENITIPKKVSNIGYEAFQGCNNVKYMLFLDNVSQVDGTAFDGCVNLSTFIVSKNNKSLNAEDGILYDYGYTRLITNPTPENRVNIRYSVQTIDERAFRGTQNLNCVTFNRNVNNIGVSAFENCTKLGTIVFLPQNCPQISVGAFDTKWDEDEKGVVYLTPNNEDNYISRNDAGDITLKNANLPPTMLYDYKTLPLIFKLKTVNNRLYNLPFGYYDVTGGDIQNISTEVDFGDGTLTSFSVSEMIGNKIEYISKDYSTSTLDSITKSNPIVTAKFTDNNSNVLSIGRLFQGYSYITDIWLPKSLERLGEHFAYNALELSSIHLDKCNNLTSIGNYAFALTKIIDFNLPTSIINLGEKVLYNNKQLLSIDFSKNYNLEILPKYMCCYCDALSSVNLRSVRDDIGITTILERSFFQCKNIKSLELPLLIKRIDPYAFYGCTQISSDLNFNQCETIGNDAFYQCANIKNISFGNQSFDRSVTIGSYVFYGCTQISSITLNLKANQLVTIDSRGVKTSNIGSNAFGQVGTNAIKTIVDSKNKYTGATLNASKLNRILVPKGELEKYIDTTKYTLQKGYENLPKPVNPNDTTTQISYSDIRWIYDEIV